jgi:hypothetical protein
MKTSGSRFLHEWRELAQTLPRDACTTPSHDASLERQLLQQRGTFFPGSIAMKPRIEKRAVPVALGPTQDQTESGDFHPASREIKQGHRST